jgi:uncharacterized protein YbjT (DUF2867 family)
VATTSRVCIIGGTGFVGRHLINRLSNAGYQCVVPSRQPQRFRQLEVGNRVELIKADLFDESQLDNCLQGCDAAINLVGILNESSATGQFHRIHVELTDRIVESCKRQNVNRLLHMSALNADESRGKSIYLKTKGEAENRVHTLGQPQIRVTSFRPSVIFGHDDSFFNRFAQLLKTLPGPFPLACPNARFAPVFVGDVTEAFARALHDRTTWRQHYELCGPRAFTLRELVEYTAGQLGLNRPVIGLNNSLSALQGKLFQLLPGKPFTYDNYLSMQSDSVCSQDGLAQLGIAATDIDAVVPYFLAERSEKRRYRSLRSLV